MTKVITYGTYDLLHQGHINLLKKAKALGDYLIVGVTSDNFDKQRGKLNVQQSLVERIEGVKALNIADKIIVEEYEGQKIDDIIRYDVDIFTVGSDWVGKFDYLNRYCKVVYLPRTEGISSSEIRHKTNKIRLGFVGESTFISKFVKEIKYINYFENDGIFTENPNDITSELKQYVKDCSYENFLKPVDAIYIATQSMNKFEMIKQALLSHKHVLCESPINCSQSECKILFDLAKQNNVILLDGNKTAYLTAYYSLLLMVKSGKIGKIVSIDATCTNCDDMNILKDNDNLKEGSFYDLAPVVMLPAFQLLGPNYKSKQIVSYFVDENKEIDLFSNIHLIFDDAVANLKVGKGIKSESSLIISGTKGYIYAPAPWWKAESFEIKFENELNNIKFFYKLDGEGARQELSVFAKSIILGKNLSHIEEKISLAIAKVIEDFYNKNDVVEIDVLHK